MRATIQAELNKLNGLKLRDAGRATNLFWLGFGEMISLTRRGVTEEVPEVAMHILCTWRLSRGSKILVASQDFYSPRSNWDEKDRDFDWDVPGDTRFDEKINELFKILEKDLIVTEVETDPHGGLKILFLESYVLEVFPDSSDDSEFWRFFNRKEKSPHFVVSGDGVEYV